MTGIVCRGPGCQRQVKVKYLGLCDSHYKQRYKGKPLTPIVHPVLNPECRVSWCGEQRYAKGLCRRHHARLLQGRDLEKPWRPMAPKGAGTIDSRGYKVVGVNGRRDKEHRIIMEGILGRRLFSDEQVHHKNGDRLDNRPENLELWSVSQPPGQRVVDKIKWAKEILVRYGEFSDG